jgi:hypothetical protein
MTIATDRRMTLEEYLDYDDGNVCCQIESPVPATGRCLYSGCIYYEVECGWLA